MAGPAAACIVPDGAAAMRAEVVERSNAARTENDRQPLEQSDTLAEVARDHACWMAETGTFSHTGEGGSSIADRAREAGYDYRFIAENIAFGQRTPEEVVTGWMNSKSHRRNLLATEAREIGIAIAANDEGRLYWVMSLGQVLSR